MYMHTQAVGNRNMISVVSVGFLSAVKTAASKNKAKKQKNKDLYFFKQEVEVNVQLNNDQLLE